MRRQRSVKILATLGPASSSREMIAALFKAGADAFRINMSHTPHEDVRALVEKIRSVEEEFSRPIAILVDLQGPKLRLGTFGSDEGEMLEEGQDFALYKKKKTGDKKGVHLPHPEIFDALEVGHTILIDDGKVKLKVSGKTKDGVMTRVLTAGKVSNRKGASFPDSVLPMGALTEKDFRDLEFAITLGIDWVALSFIQRPEDIAEARKIIRARARVISKIEKPVAVERLSEIIELSDAIMVARGDLGVEMPIEKVPGIQKRITRLCRAQGKPVVVATQMLESMITSPMPTRAEVSDVAIAVFEGADAVMLSAESAVGDYAIEAVSMMDRIGQEVAEDSNYPAIIEAQRPAPESTGADAIAAAARQVAQTLNLPAIVCYTTSGATALRVARERPLTPILSLSPVKETGRRLALCWGVHSVLTEDAHDQDDMVERACRIAYEDGYAKPGQRIIVTAGVPFGTPGTTNLLRIAYVNEAETERDL